MNTCKNCKFGRNEKTGEVICVRFPPSIFPAQKLNALTRQIDQGFISIFPNCPEVNMACGEWVKSEEKALSVDA